MTDTNLPDLTPVINWLENGCDPKEAAKELRLHQQAIDALKQSLAQPAQSKICPYCDDTGDVHRADGEWLGTCTCPAGRSAQEPEYTVEIVLAVLNDKGGFDSWWGGIDLDTQDEIKRDIASALRAQQPAQKSTKPLIADRLFSAVDTECELECAMCDFGLGHYVSSHVDPYDSSIEFHECPVDMRLSEDAKKWLFGQGFLNVWLRHMDGMETHYYHTKDGIVEAPKKRGHWAESQQPVQAAMPEVALTYLNDADKKAFLRFCEICEDTESGGYDVPKDAMRRLADIGVLRSLGFGRYETTAFGGYVYNAIQGDVESLPLRTWDDKENDYRIEMQSALNGAPSQHIEVDAQ